jgi:lipid-binding SYLF domain-containing protein
MLSYSRSRGLFAGVSLQGATLRPDADANEELYGKKIENRTILTTPVPPPASAGAIETLLNRNSSRRTR